MRLRRDWLSSTLRLLYHGHCCRKGQRLRWRAARLIYGCADGRRFHCRCCRIECWCLERGSFRLRCVCGCPCCIFGHPVCRWGYGHWRRFGRFKLKHWLCGLIGHGRLARGRWRDSSCRHGPVKPQFRGDRGTAMRAEAVTGWKRPPTGSTEPRSLDEPGNRRGRISNQWTATFSAKSIIGRVSYCAF
jgi:hypothetical protein